MSRTTERQAARAAARELVSEYATSPYGLNRLARRHAPAPAPLGADEPNRSNRSDAPPRKPSATAAQQRARRIRQARAAWAQSQREGGGADAAA